VQWKYADYVWSFLTAIGLIATAAQVRTSMAGGLLSDLTPRLSSQFTNLQVVLRDSNHVCLPMVRGASPSTNFDAIEARRKLVCDWLKGLTLNLPEAVPVKRTFKDEPEFPKLKMSAPPKIEDEVLQDTINRIRDAFGAYDNLQEEREALSTESKRNSLEEIYSIRLRASVDQPRSRDTLHQSHWRDSH
jgi:hypothetical protein